jgi:hypothetical protein
MHPHLLPRRDSPRIHVVNDRRAPFDVYLVDRPDQEMSVDVFDPRYQHDPPFGQLVTRCPASVFFGRANMSGAVLHCGVPEWYLTAQNMREIKDFFSRSMHHGYVCKVFAEGKGEGAKGQDSWANLSLEDRMVVGVVEIMAMAERDGIDPDAVLARAAGYFKEGWTADVVREKMDDVQAREAAGATSQEAK